MKVNIFIIWIDKIEKILSSFISDFNVVIDNISWLIFIASENDSTFLIPLNSLFEIFFGLRLFWVNCLFGRSFLISLL